MKDPVFAKNLDAGGNDTAAVLKPVRPAQLLFLH
jgi:hypothetical protein